MAMLVNTYLTTAPKLKKEFNIPVGSENLNEIVGHVVPQIKRKKI